jgi:putative ABC transport system ATP-binding protein
MNEAIQLKQVSKVYQQGKVAIRALDNVSLAIPKGKLFAVMGASGSGKSTMLHLIAGLTTPSEGEVILNGQNISKMGDKELTAFRRENIGLVFQAFNLLPTLSALENVSLPAMINGKRMKAVEDRAKMLLDKVGMSDRIQHRPDELSGGQQQRVAIARALMSQAPLVLADEPTGNLDSKTGEEVLFILKELVMEQDCTIVMVTHDPKAAAYADQIITLQDGRIIETLGMMV